MTTAPPDGPGTPEGDPNEPPPLTEADLEKFMAELGTTPETETDPEARYVDGADPRDPADALEAGPDFAAALGGAQDGAEPDRYVLVFTPVARAKDLARLCAVARIDVLVVPTDTGAIAARRIETPQRRDDWDISELLGGEPGGGDVEGLDAPDSADDSMLPREAAGLAGELSTLMPFPVVVMVAQLATDVGLEAGLSGHVTAVRYERGQAVGTVSPGLLLAQADQVAEDLVLGRTRPEDVPGTMDSTDVDPGKRGLFGLFRKDDPEG